MTDGMLSTKQTAARLGVSEGTVDNLRQAGKLPATKVGRQWRYSEDAVNTYLQAQASVSVASAPGETATFDLDKDVDVFKARKAAAIEKAEAERVKAAYERQQNEQKLKGCQDCARQAIANKELADSLIQQQNDLAHKIDELAAGNEALNAREVKLKEQAQAIAAEKRELARTKKFDQVYCQANFRQKEVTKLLDFIQAQFYGGGNVYENPEGWEAAQKLRRIWLREEGITK